MSRGAYAVLLCLVIAGAGWYAFQYTNLSSRLIEGFMPVRTAYRAYQLYRTPPDAELVVPVHSVRVARITDTWGAARAEGRTHEGQDLFAERGTPVYSATDGIVVYVGTNRLGGNVVMVLGAGGRSYYYAHLDEYGPAATVGTFVATTSILGFVGTTGNAQGTPPHLHFGVYTVDGPINPYPFLTDAR